MVSILHIAVSNKHEQHRAQRTCNENMVLCIPAAIKAIATAATIVIMPPCCS